MVGVFRRHMVKRHKERHKCEVCGRGFHKRFIMKVHMYNQHKISDPSLKVCMNSVTGKQVKTIINATFGQLPCKWNVQFSQIVLFVLCRRTLL